VMGISTRGRSLEDISSEEFSIPADPTLYT